MEQGRIRIEILDSAAAIAAIGCGYVFLSCLGSTIYFTSQKLRLNTERKSKQTLISIFGEQPAFVWILKNDVEIQIPFEAMQAGDIIVVNAGEPVPADGIIIYGNASIDQHVLTGESVYIEKNIGDPVFASTIIISGRVHIQVEKAGQETVAAKISTILRDTADFTASVESLGQEIADNSVLPTFAISAAGFPLVGVHGAVALLSSDFFDTMRIAAPLSMMNFLNIASNQGILIKDGRSLQILPTIDTVVFDKTGTLTSEQPYISKIYASTDLQRKRF
ncbi:MAG: HAD-IC family P-type ATPase [Desulfobacteraceae bacterium]|nr:HAD-IC family P-type ATPase [Desulfobacteraceae bacterium]